MSGPFARIDFSCRSYSVADRVCGIGTRAPVTSQFEVTVQDYGFWYLQHVGVAASILQGAPGLLVLL